MPGLTNARRHAGAEHVVVALTWRPGEVCLTVSDRRAPEPVLATAGPVPTGATPSRGHGLIGMRERAELAGGHLRAGPTDDGFEVALWLPT